MAGRQATGSILTDAGDLYKRLLNHRPVMQNEVHFFLKEFELKREDSGLKNLQDAMRYANEMDSIFLEAIMTSSHQFRQITSEIEAVNVSGSKILDEESTSSLGLPTSGQDELDKQVEECRQQFHEKQELFDSEQAKQVEQLKEEIRVERETREKLRPPSQSASVGSSVTIFPPEVSSVETSSAEHSEASNSPVPTQTVEEVKTEETEQTSDNVQTGVDT